MTVRELIEKLNKFNPDGDATVVEHFNENDPDDLDDICRISMEEDADENLVVVLHTAPRQTEISRNYLFLYKYYDIIFVQREKKGRKMKPDGNILVFDTETISLEKSFIYNLGYVIVDPDGKTLLERSFVIRQIYDNKPLFATSYYAKKRPLYISMLKGRRTKKVSWGDACRLMCKDIKEYGVQTDLPSIVHLI